MPELPEIQVCKLGITPHILNKKVTKVNIRTKKLRWPVPDEITKVTGESVISVERRAKYLLLKFTSGTLLLHLGMSGTIRIVDENTPLVKHDHFDLFFENKKVLRLNDPRRFGAVLWLEDHIDEQGILAKLGPEPLSADFDNGYLYSKANNRKLPIKTFLMSNAVVVGVGNIYANEALFQAGILPDKPVNEISEESYDTLTAIIKDVLARAIEQGGTTLKDFTDVDGKPGYFAQKLHVYGRAGKACHTCGSILEEIRQSGRSSVFCGTCQT